MALEKIEKTILTFKDFRLIHSVSLGCKAKDGTRKSNIFLRSYKSTKYKDESSLSTLYVDSNDYLVFRHSVTKDEVYFSYPHLVTLLSKLKNIHKRLVNESDKIFIEKDNQTLLNVDYKGNVKIYGAANSIVYLGFSIFDDGDDEYCGVSLYLNKEENLVNLTTDELATLIYIINKIDLYSSSLLLLSSSNINLDELSKPSYSNSGSRTINKNAGKPVVLAKKKGSN